jgi:hypothetical protein
VDAEKDYGYLYDYQFAAMEANTETYLAGQGTCPTVAPTQQFGTNGTGTASQPILESLVVPNYNPWTVDALNFSPYQTNVLSPSDAFTVQGG